MAQRILAVLTLADLQVGGPHTAQNTLDHLRADGRLSAEGGYTWAPRHEDGAMVLLADECETTL